MSARVQCRKQKKKRIKWLHEWMKIKLGAQTQTHGEEFKSLDQANHGSPARFTWRSRFREARDQDSL